MVRHGAPSAASALPSTVAPITRATPTQPSVATWCPGGAPDRLPDRAGLGEEAGRPLGQEQDLGTARDGPAARLLHRKIHLLDQPAQPINLGRSRGKHLDFGFDLPQR